MGSSGERGFQWWYRVSNFSFRILCLKTSARNIIILVLSLFGNSSITLCRCSCCWWPCPSTHTVCSAGTCTPWPPCDVQEPLYCTPTHGVRVQVLHDPPVLCRCSCTVQYCTSTQYAVHVLHDPLCCAGAAGGADGGCQVHWHTVYTSTCTPWPPVLCRCRWRSRWWWPSTSTTPCWSTVTSRTCDCTCWSPPTTHSSSTSMRRDLSGDKWLN